MKKFIGIIICLLVPTLSWAASDPEGELLAADLSKAIDEYKALDRDPIHYDVVLRRDPMQKLVSGKENVANPAGFHTGLTVQGIVRSNNSKSILVNDELYSEGDTVGLYRVLEIRENGFLAGDGNKEVFVPLYAENAIPVSSENSSSQQS